MLLRSLCILSGAYALGLMHSLPDDDLFLPVLFLAGASARLARFRCLAWFVAGFAITWVAAWIVIDDRLDPALQGETISIAARIADFPRATGDTLRFDVEPEDRSDRMDIRIPAVSTTKAGCFVSK